MTTFERHLEISNELKNELGNNKRLYNEFMHEADAETARRILEEYKISSAKLISLKKRWMENLQKWNEESQKV